MQWLFLILAGLLEIGWAIGLKYTEGFTRLWPSVFTLSAMLASIGLLGLAMKTLPVGTAYAVWMGIGAAGTVIFGIYLFDESTSVLRLASVGLILLGVLGLKLSA
ncbi:MAG TPA: quaternary ammonium compound efflux SMR transporter SugE [Rhodocyclaceae bacterium]